MEQTPAENYQQFFVPAIGAPAANDLMDAAKIQQGERVLDIACGTGVVTRLAAGRVGARGSVAGLELNPAMLAVARAHTPPGVSIDWHQASAESMPLPPADFLWQYILSTPLAEALAQAGQAKRDALERDVCAQWQEFVVDGSLCRFR